VTDDELLNLARSGLSTMKMIYRKFPKTASLPVTCHPASYLRNGLV